MAGRPPTPTADLKLHGTYREDRHGDRADVAGCVGQPVRPADLDEAGVELWDTIIAEHEKRGILGEIDTAALHMLCEHWSLWNRAKAMAKNDPIDKEIRCAVTGYAGVIQKLLAKFGGTPVDRAALKINNARGGKENPLVSFGRKRG